MSHHAHSRPRRWPRKPVDLVGTITAWAYGIGTVAALGCLGLAVHQQQVHEPVHLPSGISLPDFTQE